MKFKLLLYLGIAALFFSFIAVFIYDKVHNTTREVYVQESVLQTIAETKSEQLFIQKHISSEPQNVFSDYFLESDDQPYFIYLGDSLVFWSSNTFIPEFYKVKNTESESLIRNNYDEYILVKSEFVAKNGYFTLVSLINLSTQQDKTSEEVLFNSKIFKTQQVLISSDVFIASYPIKNSFGKDIFYFKSERSDYLFKAYYPSWIFVLFSITAVLLSVFCYLNIINSRRHKNYLHSFGYIVGLVMVLRIWLMFFNSSKFAFNEKFKGAYWLIPADLRNAIFSVLAIFTILAYLSVLQRKLSVLSNFKNELFSKFIPVVLLMITIFLGVIIYNNLDNLYTFETISLNYSIKFFKVDLKLATQVYIYLLLGIYILFNQVVLHIYSINFPKKSKGWFPWAYASALSFSVCLMASLDIHVALISSFFFIIAYYFSFQDYYYKIRFKTFLYFLFGALTFSMILYHFIIKENNKQDEKVRHNFALSLLQQRNHHVEMQLDDLKKKLDLSSSQLDNIIVQPVLAGESLNHFVIDSLIGNSLSNLDAKLYSFSQDGRPLQPNQGFSLQQFKDEVEKGSQFMGYKDLYFQNLPNQQSKYRLFHHLKNGTIIVELTLSQETQVANILALAEREIFHNPSFRNMSIGVFNQNGTLISQLGGFKEYNTFNANLFSETNNTLSDIVHEKYNHTIAKGALGKTLVVSQPKPTFSEQISNFSYLFLLSLIGTLFYLFLLALFTGIRAYRLGYSAKIQFFLNLAFLVPISLISVLTLFFVFKEYLKKQDQSLKDITQNVSELIDVQYQGYENGKSSKSYLEEQLSNIGNSADFNINVYDKSGKIMYMSNHSYFLENNLTDYINPQALIELQNKKLVLISNKIKNEELVTAYTKGKVRQNKNYDIISVEFPYVKIAQEEQVASVISSVLRLFLVMFIVLLILSFIASYYLTSPLKLLAEKFRQVNLEKENEVLPIEMDDEIGHLTQEYNSMIVKLHESKHNLAEKEKQSAWREMAKQVAHEIKNPLTPMKLTIQQLQRTIITNDDLDTNQRIDKALSSINEQIDTISEIANSFSEFAKMPIPKYEVFNLVSAVETIVNLYRQDKNVQISFIKSDDEPIMVLGDYQVLGRAVNNLILNGIQSVRENVQPIITIVVSEKEAMGLVEVHDNGLGIKEELKKKIFVPNFSTKINGSGLGLSLAKWGIEYAGGNIWFESVEEVGTVFFIDLPLSKEPTAQY